ncbi:amidohydrolase family protein [Fodinicola feengrottensis]|uniref:amidohydrolase family protein n=1 Tax=Fodinicola feengrottensis TaxID=435914 RepID=UPI0013D06A4B|nr:amidohydrolase family protein [Fodinicola feengrottensis]
MRTIALEEHYVTPEYMASEGRWLEPYQQVVRPLLDLGAGRIAAMDAGGVDLAVLSLTRPGVAAARLRRGHHAIYLHPTPPPTAVTEAIYGGFSADISFSLSTTGWGWHIDTALHVLRLIVSGVFDRYPTLQVIVGHMGETLPFMLPRFDVAFAQRMSRLELPVSGYLRRNISYTFSGFNERPTFDILLAQMGVDRIMFSTDYPYGSMATATEFLAGLPLDEASRESIAFGNAEKLMKL